MPRMPDTAGIHTQCVATPRGRTRYSPEVQRPHRQGAHQGDPSVGSGWHSLKSRDQVGTLAICLSTFAGNRIRGGFRQRCGPSPSESTDCLSKQTLPRRPSRSRDSLELVKPFSLPALAVPSSSLRARPIRVANHVTANREKSAANAPGPAQANRTKQTMPPAIAPVRDTPEPSVQRLQKPP